MVKSIWSFEYPADLYRFGNFAGVNSMAYLLSLIFFLEYVVCIICKRQVRFAALFYLKYEVGINDDDDGDDDQLF